MSDNLACVLICACAAAVFVAGTVCDCLAKRGRAR